MNLSERFPDEEGEFQQSGNPLAANDFSNLNLPPLRFPLLEALFLGGTSVSDLSPLSGLASLRSLNASRCHLTEFPQTLLRAERPIWLQLFETRIPGIPAEVLSQEDFNDDCRARLLAHVADLVAGAEPVTDVKVIVIGNGRIGKTQICNRLRGEDYEDDADSTHGITVTQTNLPMPGDSQPALLNLWDFGGQDLYHGTHALFLESRVLFVVAWTPATNNNSEYEHGGMRFRNQPLPYWLDYVRHAAGNVCPVVLVQNQCDTPQDEVLQPPADPDLLQAFPYLQQVHYSAKEDRSSDPQRAGRVEEFCTKLEAAGIKIVRDTKDLPLGDRISTFMREMIGNSDRVYLFLSEAYLKSPNCMYELLTIWRTSHETMTEFKNICEFAAHVDEMLAQIADVLQPPEFDRYINHAIEDY